MKYFIYLFAFILISNIHQEVFSQSVSLSDIRDPYLDGIKPIIEKDVVQGYYLFVLLDKVDRKNANYQIRIYDANLKEKFVVDLIRPRNYILAQSGFNDSHLGFMFLDPTARIVELVVVNSEGEISGSYKTEKKGNREFSLLTSEMEKGGNPYTFSLQGVPGRGFIFLLADTENGFNSRVTLVDEKGIKKWEVLANLTTEKDYGFAFPLNSNNEHMVSLVNTRETFLSQKLKESYLSIISNSTGKQVAKIKNQTKSYVLSPAGVNMEKNKSFVVFGEYFNLKDNIYKDRSQGIYFIEYSLDGKIIKDNYNSWTKDLKKGLGLDAKGKTDDKMTLCVQEITQTANKRIFAVCEQFRKAADGAGIALNVIGGVLGSAPNAAMAKAVKGDLVILELDSTFELLKVHKYDKEKSDVTLMSGAEYLSTSFIGTYLKYTGAFDFRSLTRTPDQTGFNVLYINYDREKGEKSNYVIGNISYDGNNMVKDNFRLSDKPTRFIALPGKSGNVVIYEYFRKDKKLRLRIEKLKK